MGATQEFPTLIANSKDMNLSKLQETEEGRGS